MGFSKYSVKTQKRSRLQHGQLNTLLYLLGHDYSIATSMITASETLYVQGKDHRC